MATAVATQGWIQLPSGRYVSANSMQKWVGKPFSLFEAENMDVAAFNKEAARYDVHMDESDAPIDRLVKYSLFLSRRDEDGSQILTNDEYVGMLFEVASSKAKKPFSSFYKTLRANHVDVTRDVLEFHGKVSKGTKKGKYEVKLLRFDEYGRLQPIDDIIVAPKGWIAAIDLKRGYPVETSETFTRVKNTEIMGLEDYDASGYWSIGNTPKKGEQRINIHAPISPDGGILTARADMGRSCSDEDVEALRTRRAA